MPSRDLFDYSDWDPADVERLRAPLTPEEQAYHATSEWCSRNEDFLFRYPGHLLTAIGRELLSANLDWDIAVEQGKARCRELGYREEDIVIVHLLNGFETRKRVPAKGSDQ